MFKAPEMTFAAFVAASFLTSGLVAVVTDFGAKPAVSASVVSEETIRRGARVTPTHDHSMTMPVAITEPRRGARTLTVSAPTTMTQAETALAYTIDRGRREI